MQRDHGQFSLLPARPLTCVLSSSSTTYLSYLLLPPPQASTEALVGILNKAEIPEYAEVVVAPIALQIPYVVANLTSGGRFPKPVTHTPCCAATRSPSSLCPPCL